MKFAVPCMLLIVMLSGCETAPPAEGQLDAQIASIQSTVGIGLSVVLNKAGPDRAREIKSYMEDIVIPVLEDEDLTTITRATTDKALELLSDKLNAQEKAMVQEGVNLVLAFVHLPDNPIDKVAEHDRLRILALFQGVVRGCNIYLAGQPAPTDGLGVSFHAPLTWEVR